MNFNISITTLINIGSLFVAIITLIYLFKTYKTSQRQTSMSLAINQYNIYHSEFKDFLEEAKNLRFRSESLNLNQVGLADATTKYNGLNYIEIFLCTIPGSIWREKLAEFKLEHSFRSGVLFPLTLYHDRLYDFLCRINNDPILSGNYKGILYNYIERDLLQAYFRICNNTFRDSLEHNILEFSTNAYDAKSFYAINDFYINNNAFRYKSLQFYQNTH